MSGMLDVPKLLELAKSTAIRATACLRDASLDMRDYEHDEAHPREVKASADLILETEILELLAPEGLTILSEETGLLDGSHHPEYRFIIDPLDGTFNYVKQLGPSAVSIALWKQETPIFGVLSLLPEETLIWGGAGIGAFRDGVPISVSGTQDYSRASICTGFPVRFDMTSEKEFEKFWTMAGRFAKVRMIGSAATSLANVACGFADAYVEYGIMLWDVAAGLAIVEGAGGASRVTLGDATPSLNVIAANPQLLCSW